jgi:hypothetical protein
MTTFLALYRGRTVAEAKMVAVTADPTLVATVAAHLLDTPPPQGEDRVVETLERGRRAALRLIRQESRSVRVSGYGDHALT